MGDTMTDLAATPTDTSGWTVPTSLSPSRVESFLSCPLAFRFSSIQKLPDPPGTATTRGSLVPWPVSRTWRSDSWQKS